MESVITEKVPKAILREKSMNSKTSAGICVISLCVLALFAPTFVNQAAAAVPTVDVTVNRATTIGTSNYESGFMLDQDWTYYRDDSICRSLTTDANFKLVRVINFKDTSPQPCVYWYESTKTGKWNWTETDRLIKRVFDAGAQPLVTLKSFPTYGQPPGVPPGMKINTTTNLPNPENFAAYCAAWVKHYKNLGKPIKYWEVLNEAWYYFFQSWGIANPTRLSNFVVLLDTCVKRMREVDSTILVGNDAATFKCFLDYYVTHGSGLGFLSFHKYDSGNIADTDATVLNSAETKGFETSSTQYGPADAKNRYRAAFGVEIPILLTETNLSYVWQDGSDPKIQKVVGSVWTALMIRSCIMKGIRYSVYYCFSSDGSSEQTKTTGGLGFGMINNDNDKPWYPYYVHQMISTNLAIGDKLVETTSSASEIRTLGWLHDGKLNLLIICKADSARNIRLSGFTKQADYSKIDKTISYLTPRVQTGEIDTANLLYLNGYTVMLLTDDVRSLIGDVNHDGKVNIQDTAIIGAAYASSVGSPNWNPNADIAEPFGRVDLLDIVVCTLHYGEENP